MRWRISAADLLVKVTQRMFPGRMPASSTRKAKRWDRARVLPEPAPAMTRNTPSVEVTASHWASLSPASSSLILHPPLPPPVRPGGICMSPILRCGWPRSQPPIRQRLHRPAADRREHRSKTSPHPHRRQLSSRRDARRLMLGKPKRFDLK